MDPRRSPVPDAVFDRMVELRRDLHRHPELSGREHRTAERLSGELERLGIPHRRIAGTGLVADLEGGAPGPRVALRADIDALPIQEETGLPFSSEVDGVMHACGHDGHAAMLTGAAALLSRGPPPPVPVRLIFQPAEERGEGAAAMMDEGALDGVDMIFAGHLDRHYAPGELVVADGPVNASSDSFTIEISGREGHGARPHEALDAVVVGSLLVTALQTIVSREIDPAHPSVLSVGLFQAGTARNVIAGHARLEGTIRAQGAEVRRHLQESLQRIALAIGQLHGAQVDVRLSAGTPPVQNSPEMAGIGRWAAVDVVGEDRVVPLRTTNMGGEDFGLYLERARGCYARIGARVAGRESHPAHSSRFDIDERALGSGAAWLARVAHVAGEHLRAEEP